MQDDDNHVPELGQKQVQGLGLVQELTPYELLCECRDAGMKKVVADIRTYAGNRSVFIGGENGTGKKLVAQSLHYLGGRRDKPFVALDCGNLDEPLLRSELFGHMRGSFTGANDVKHGIFERVNGGTAFLDEIGEIPLSLQARFLQVLEDHTFRPVGSSKDIPTDFHLITATNRNLLQMVVEGRFRRDLYHRIELLRIRVPSLRERGDDIVRLAEHFVDQFSKNTKLLDATAKQAIQAYSWPGNVRELRNAIERAVIISQEREEINRDDLDLTEWDIRDQLMHVPTTGGENTSLQIVPAVTYDARFLEIVNSAVKCLLIDGKLNILEAMEAAAIKITLEKCNGNKVDAAKKLGIGRQTLYNKLARYGLQ